MLLVDFSHPVSDCDFLADMVDSTPQTEANPAGIVGQGPDEDVLSFCKTNRLWLHACMTCLQIRRCWVSFRPSFNVIL
jgi:hypothetical protein